MREFKFRAWDKSLKRMSYDPLNVISFDGRFYYGIADITGYPQEVMQYTGLKDKNGKEIYEGDVCKYREDTEGQIIFEDGCFWFDCTDWSEPICIFSDWEFEVIGNIHENPELLEVE